jgi:hypothetical protein
MILMARLLRLESFRYCFAGVISRALRVFIATTAAVLISGCAVFGTHIQDVQIVDLRLINLTAVDESAQPAPTTNWSPRRSFFGFNPSGPWLAVYFTTSANLHTIALRYDNQGLNAEMCNGKSGQRNRLVAAGLAFSNAPFSDLKQPERSDQSNAYFKSVAARNFTGKFTYVAFIRTRRAQREQVGGSFEGLYEPFDLHRQPEAVCVNLFGGTMIGFRYESNTVEIRPDQIRAALNKPLDLHEIK